MIVDILRGSKNEKLLRFGFDTLSTFAIMSDTSAHRIRLILDYLINEGFLLQEEGEYPVVTLGRAQALLGEKERVFMKLPQEREKSPDKEIPRQTGEKHSLTQNLSGDIDENLFGKLQKLRKEIAAREAVPAYIVFPDASLRDMCRKKPVSLGQFSGVNGVGSVKLEKYGKMFIDLIREYCETEPFLKLD
jgi:ATP-dependent DNA helicase RecQ